MFRDLSRPQQGALGGAVAGLVLFVQLPSLPLYLLGVAAAGFVGGTLPLLVRRWRAERYRTVAAIGVAYLFLGLAGAGIAVGLYGDCMLPAFSQEAYRNMFTDACETFRVNACGQGRPPWYWTGVAACG